METYNLKLSKDSLVIGLVDKYAYINFLTS